MSNRKVKGIAAFVSGIISIVLGGFFMWADVTPDWVPQALLLIGIVADFFGFKLVYPDKD